MFFVWLSLLLKKRIRPCNQAQTHTHTSSCVGPSNSMGLSYSSVKWKTKLLSGMVRRWNDLDNPAF